MTRATTEQALFAEMNEANARDQSFKAWSDWIHARWYRRCQVICYGGMLWCVIFYFATGGGL
jgi:hypothetical protein